jgi:hypothetical protein
MTWSPVHVGDDRSCSWWSQAKVLLSMLNRYFRPLSGDAASRGFSRYRHHGRIGERDLRDQDFAPEVSGPFPPGADHSRYNIDAARTLCRC